MELKKFIDVHVPVFSCNLCCDYCYVGKNFGVVKKVPFLYSTEIVQKSLSKERLGGTCHFNICGMGETLLPAELIHYIRVILENGHTVMIVTNGTLTVRFEEYMKFPQILKDNLGFKFSLHYLELKRLGLLETFWNNVKLVKKNGCSFSVELTAADSYEPFIDEIKKSCIDHTSSLCHISIPRDESDLRYKLFSKHTIEEFYNVWKTFDSPMLDLKKRHWNEKRKEFCYAGLWSGLLNLGNGEFNGCYRQPGPIGNLFEHPEKAFEFKAMGSCAIAHCFNGHSFLSLGVIPEICEETYEQIRDRVDADGSHWLNQNFREQFSRRLKDDNEILNPNKKKKYLCIHQKDKITFACKKVANKLKKCF